MTTLLMLLILLGAAWTLWCLILGKASGVQYVVGLLVLIAVRLIFGR